MAPNDSSERPSDASGHLGIPRTPEMPGFFPPPPVSAPFPASAASGVVFEPKPKPAAHAHATEAGPPQLIWQQEIVLGNVADATPHELIVADDGTAWAAGSFYDDETDSLKAPKSFLTRHDATGKVTWKARRPYSGFGEVGEFDLWMALWMPPAGVTSSHGRRQRWPANSRLIRRLYRALKRTELAG